MEETKPTIKVGDKGPFIIKGGASLVYPYVSKEINEGTLTLYHCEISANKPFCNGPHKEWNTWL